jgi:hypothetical protein
MTWNTEFRESMKDLHLILELRHNLLMKTALKIYRVPAEIPDDFAR